MENILEKRIMLLEDIEAIKTLKALYCHLVDEGIAGDISKMDELMTHFVGDAWIDFGSDEVPDIHEGRQAISKFYKESVCSALSYSMHIVANPMIEVTGDKARGKWYVFVPCVLRQTNAAFWLAGKYKEEYLKQDGRWKWLSMSFRSQIQAPFEGKGWGGE